MIKTYNIASLIKTYNIASLIKTYNIASLIKTYNIASLIKTYNIAWLIKTYNIASLIKTYNIASLIKTYNIAMMSTWNKDEHVKLLIYYKRPGTIFRSLYIHYIFQIAFIKDRWPFNFLEMINEIDQNIKMLEKYILIWYSWTIFNNLFETLKNWYPQNCIWNLI